MTLHQLTTGYKSTSRKHVNSYLKIAHDLSNSQPIPIHQPEIVGLQAKILAPL